MIYEIKKKVLTSIHVDANGSRTAMFVGRAFLPVTRLVGFLKFLEDLDRAFISLEQGKRAFSFIC